MADPQPCQPPLRRRPIDPSSTARAALLAPDGFEGVATPHRERPVAAADRAPFAATY
ncbi:MAG: hypothetical protein QHG99_02300 [Methanomicrobiales archaeon]|nr:hypothetical protein [Methanomicrobiales archaeon]